MDILHLIYSNHAPILIPYPAVIHKHQAMIRPFIQAIRLKENATIYFSVLFISLLIAAFFPITNDESYYLAYAKNLQLSYVDAPPFVSYLTAFQVHCHWLYPLSLRALVIVLHLISTLMLMAIVYQHEKHSPSLATRLKLTFLMAYLIPIFGLYGIFILPDVGLILSLSILLWTADRIIQHHEFHWKYVLVLGVALGIGLLSKYHILPLGGGMLMGLYIDLSLRTHWRIAPLFKLCVSGIIGLLCAYPVFAWNIHHHFASFVFQLEHGFRSNTWQLKTCFGFLLGASVYMTPWFAYVLFKDGLLTNKKARLLIPVGSLLIILLISSLRKSVLPHWISPAFWLLIPYAVINSARYKNRIQTLLRWCRYTAVIWVLLLLALLLPGGLMHIKTLSMSVYPDAKVFKDLLLWEELPLLLHQNKPIAQHITTITKTPQDPRCPTQQPIIATVRWFWASQMEYHQMFPGAIVLNLDLGSANFYLWRDHWADYAHCNLLLIGAENQVHVDQLRQIMHIQSQYITHGLGDYRSLNMMVLQGQLRDAITLEHTQDSLIKHPHY